MSESESDPLPLTVPRFRFTAPQSGGIFRAQEGEGMREILYGLILGAATVYCYNYFDAPGMLDYLNSATESAAKSTSGYGGKEHRQQQR